MGVEELKSMTHEDLVRKVQELQEDLDDSGRMMDYYRKRYNELKCKLHNVACLLNDTLELF